MFWKGDYDGLQELIKSDLNLSGKWLSSGGETKEFIHRDFILKWKGKSKQHLVVVKDNQNSYLANGLKHCANEMVDVNTHFNSKSSEDEFVEHVVVEIIDQDENNVSCHNEDQNQLDLNKVMTMISELKEMHEKERQNAIAQAAKSEEKNQALIEGQTKMAAEIQALKTTVEKLENENKSIKLILDFKQDEWVKVQAKNGSTLKTNERKSKISIKNSFIGLEIEDTNFTSFPEIVETDKETERSSQKKENYHVNNDANFPKVSKTPGNTATKHQDPAKPNDIVTLVIGDSMVKNIDSKKIERASRHKSVCHSYSGAKVKQIEEKLKNDSNGKYDSVILHVGTNDLSHSDANKVARDMDDLINEVKIHTNKIAVSSVIRRYDGKVYSNKIDQYNKLLENICLKHNVTLINNNNIDESRLNGSKLHLNSFGDIALGSAFCSYLKSLRAKTPGSLQGYVNSRNNHFLSKAHGHRTREWTIYLDHVRRMTT